MLSPRRDDKVQTKKLPGKAVLARKAGVSLQATVHWQTVRTHTWDTDKYAADHRVRIVIYPSLCQLYFDVVCAVCRVDGQQRRLPRQGIKTRTSRSRPRVTCQVSNLGDRQRTRIRMYGIRSFDLDLRVSRKGRAQGKLPRTPHYPPSSPPSP